MSHIDPNTLALIALGESALPADLDHIRGCVMCQSEVDELTAIAASARSIDAEDRPIAPPAFVWENIESALNADSPAHAGSAINSTNPANPTDPAATVTVRRKSRSMFALAASVGVLIGGLGTYFAVSTDDSSARATVVAQASLDPIRDVKDPASASVQQIDGREVLNVQASGLPATDGFYEVWLLAPDATSMISVGMLDASEGGQFPLPAGIDLEAFPIVDISLEHFDGDSTHSADSILRGTLII